MLQLQYTKHNFGNIVAALFFGFVLLLLLKL